MLQGQLQTDRGPHGDPDRDQLLVTQSEGVDQGEDVGGQGGGGEVVGPADHLGLAVRAGVRGEHADSGAGEPVGGQAQRLVADPTQAVQQHDQVGTAAVQQLVPGPAAAYCRWPASVVAVRRPPTAAGRGRRRPRPVRCPG